MFNDLFLSINHSFINSKLRYKPNGLVVMHYMSNIDLFTINTWKKK